MMEVVATTGALEYVATLQSNRHHQETNTVAFDRPGALPVAQPALSKPLKGKQ